MAATGGALFAVPARAGEGWGPVGRARRELRGGRGGWPAGVGERQVLPGAMTVTFSSLNTSSMLQRSPYRAAMPAAGNAATSRSEVMSVNVWLTWTSTPGVRVWQAGEAPAA